MFLVQLTVLMDFFNKQNILGLKRFLLGIHLVLITYTISFYLRTMNMLEITFLQFYETQL